MDEEPQPWWRWPLFFLLLLLTIVVYVYFKDLRFRRFWGG